jgi:hypothetical protein
MVLAIVESVRKLEVGETLLAAIDGDVAADRNDHSVVHRIIIVIILHSLYHTYKHIIL